MTTCKCTFSVTTTCRLRPNDSVGVCISDSAAVTPNSFDPARTVQLVRLDAAAAAALAGDDIRDLAPSPQPFLKWTTAKPIAVPGGGAPIKYKYAVFSNGVFSRWEQLSGGAHQLTPMGKVSYELSLLGEYCRRGMYIWRTQ